METTGVVLRDVRDDDDLDALNEGCTVWFGGDPVRRLMTVGDGAPKQMWVAEVDGASAGFGQVVGHGVSDGHRGIGYVFVRPEFRRRGVGRLLWDAVLDVAGPDRVPGVKAQADDCDATTLEIALAHGFTLRGRHIESVLDLGRADELRHHTGAPRAAGLVIGPLPEDADETTWRSFAEAFNRMVRDAPDYADGAEEMPFETMRAVLEEPWQVWGAWDEGRMVGLTCLVARDRDARVLNTMLTAVEPERRGLGLATALKASHALAVREAGWSSIVTQNMEGNEAILASNRRLGFVPTMAKRDLFFDYA